MLVESICIILIILIIAFSFLRNHHAYYALAVSPLLIVPFFHLVVYLINDLFNITILANIKAGVDVFALAIAVALMGLVSSQLKKRKSKLAYLLVCGGFTTILALIFIFDNYALVTLS